MWACPTRSIRQKKRPEMNAPKLPLTLTICLAAVGMALPVRAVTMISDGTFNNTDWNATKVDDSTVSGDASVVATQIGTGGNPGAYRDIIHVWDVVPGGVSVTFAHLFTPLTFDPSTGTITSLSVSFSAFCDAAPIVNAIGFGPILKQDGIYYAHSAGAAALRGNGWTSFNFANLTELSFFDYYNTGSAHPDFSAAGSPIQLGFWSGNGGSGFTSANHTASGGVDNFQINATIAPIPEPSQFAMIGLSGVMGLVIRRFRKK